MLLSHHHKNDPDPLGGPEASGSGSSKGVLSRASKLGSDTLHNVRKFTGDHVRIPYLSASPTTAHHNGSPVLTGSSIAPPSHREKTALHALKDTFVLPSPSSFLPALPTIPCMSGLGQSNLFADNGATAAEELAEQAALSNGEKDAFKKLSGNVCMMGGYRGSILRDAHTGRRLWVPLRVGFNVRKADLAIGLTAEEELRTTETVVAGKSLAAIAGFVDLGKRLKDKLKTLDHEGKIRFHGWGYDWRRSLELSSAELILYLEQIKAETGEGTLVLAHSMGGLVALHALAKAKDPSIFRGIIFGSTPFAGTPNILHPFKHGDSVLFNKEICSPSTVFSFRSSFYLLPPDGICFHDSTGKSMNINFLSPEPWSKHGLSPMTAHIADGSSAEREEAIEEAGHADETVGVVPVGAGQIGDETGKTKNTIRPSSPPAIGVARVEAEEEDNLAKENSDRAILDYLNRTLENVKTFREELSDSYDIEKKHLYPPLVILASKKTPTVKGCIVDTEEQIMESSYDKLLFGEGDGIILYSSATALPEVWQPHLQATIESSNGHVSILSDLVAIRKALDAVETAHASKAV